MGMAFMIAPFLALIPALFFGFFYFKTKQKLVLSVFILWTIYALYEYGMKLRILCSGECNIRIDLLLIYPLLLVMSLIALIKIVKWYKNVK